MIDYTNIEELSLGRNLKRGLTTAALNLIAEQSERIHLDGLASDGAKIGTYSSKPFFSLFDSFVNKSGIPKDKISGTGKSVQLPEGYKSFRQYSGRESSFVNLNYTGVLEKSYTFEVSENGFVTGYPGSGDENGVTPADKMRFAESNPRFGKREIISPTSKELDNVVLLIADSIL